MKGLLSRRPSPALIIAVIALVLAMAGTGYAAFKLPKNSVGTKQIKNKAVSTAKLKKDAVTGAKVKDQSLSGSDINLGSLGTVPSANVANTANTANALAPLEATHLVGAPGEPPFGSGNGNNPGESGIKFNPVGFYKDHDGIVHLQGIAKTGPATSITPIFTLPPGFRPASGTIMLVNAFCFGEGGNCTTDSPGGDEQTYSRLLVVGSSTAVEGVALDGMVIAPPQASVSLDGITFRAAS
jgi:hypothetical protein